MLFLLLFFKNCFSKESISITAKNLNEITNNPNDLPVFIKFWSPFCPHCQNFKPIWNEFCKISNDDIIVADVDCIQQPKICTKFNVESFPTIKWIHASKKIEIEYLFGRSIEELQSFVDSQLCSPFIKIQNLSEISNQELQTNFYLFEYENDEDIIYHNVYEISRKYYKMKNPVFAIQSSSNKLTFYEYNSLKNFTDNKYGKNNLEIFFHNNIFSFFNELKPEYVSRFHLLKKPVILYFLFNPKTTKSILRTSLNSLKSKYYFMYSYYKEKDSSIRDLFTLYSKTEPFLVYINPKTKKYISTKALLTENDLLSWIKNEIDENNEEKKWKKMFPSIYTIDKNDDIFLSNSNKLREKNGKLLPSFNTLVLYLILIFLICALFLFFSSNKCQRERSPGQPIVDV